MTDNPRPMLALGPAVPGQRATQQPRPVPRVAGPGASKQGQRLSSQFSALVDAFDARRATLSSEAADEVDPELVLVFDLAGSVVEFRNAIDKIQGLEFLSELLDADLEPDDDFHMNSNGDRSDQLVGHSLYLVMSNAKAAAQLVTLFQQWQADPGIAFAHGLARFKRAFEQLLAIRPWGPVDRIRETGLLEEWRERLEVAGQTFSPVMVEIELWYRRDAAQRRAAEASIVELVAAARGTIKNQAQIGEIGYHALLVELPVQQVQSVLQNGADAIDLLNADEIMFVSPFTPMSVSVPSAEPSTDISLRPSAPSSGQPRIALLDGLPMANHVMLSDRLIIDDPDNLGANYPVASRHHGTAMASLVLHGDLSESGSVLDRPLYVRPILGPHQLAPGAERVVDDQLLTDLLHRAVRRIVHGDNNQPPAAPSVRIVNLSIGAESRSLVRRMSPLGRLIDWLAVEYNLLFLISAGNHQGPIRIPAASAGDPAQAKVAAMKAVKESSRLRRILPPGDAMNAVTVGALHADGAGNVQVTDTVWDLVDPGAPALYGAVGPGVGRSIKPDLYHDGGRALYVRPAPGATDEDVVLELAPTSRQGPGHRVAAPGRGGEITASTYSYGTSNATALVTREASRLFDLLERGADDADDEPYPDALYHPILARALLIHASSWADRRRALQPIVSIDSQQARRELTALLGYGGLDVARLGTAAPNRALLIAAGSIGRDERQTHHVPFPISLQAKAEWHRFTVTLAYQAPTSGQLTRYRGTKVFFEKLDDRAAGGTRIDADVNAVRRGSCQHEIIDGTRALTFSDGESLPIHVECMDDAQRLKRGVRVRYGLVVSVETKVSTSQTIHAEIRTRLQAQARIRPRLRP
ncbi:S8 family peptidase [Kribbella sp. NPDC003557]|uniref:S8 family peptidase n=1 Tax=Kribbella sp. NPDC003557 TaxID=3154449 RepID=UPI0033A896D7